MLNGLSSGHAYLLACFCGQTVVPFRANTLLEIKILSLSYDGAFKEMKIPFSFLKMHETKKRVPFCLKSDLFF